jgi:hypothetical protein
VLYIGRSVMAVYPGVPRSARSQQLLKCTDDL